MFKIYYKNKILILSEKEFHNIYTIKVKFENKFEIKNQIFKFLDCENSENINIYGEKPEIIIEYLKDFFVFILAAGGIVKNKNNEILYLQRLGYLDFPKGKVENNETVQQAAIREVSEECGILEKDLLIKSKLPNSYHIYPYKGKFALKETQWFEMFFKENYELKPQIEEGITNIAWSKFDLIQTKFSTNSYPSLINLIEELT